MQINKQVIAKALVPYLIVFGIGSYAGVSLVRYKPQIFLLNPIPKEQLEMVSLMEKVGKLISLPSDEQPVLETVTDTSSLKDRAFFANAEVGDKVLIFEKTAKAILYRPSKNLIIETLSPNFQEAIFSPVLPTPLVLATTPPTPVPPVETPVPVVPTPTPVPTLTPTASPLVTPTAAAR